jgi:tetratricopeptide (TPR) repeat protein
VYSCSEYQNHDLERAKTLFDQVCQQGAEIGWSRIVNYAQNELANIAISERDYECAEKTINKGLRKAEVYRESTRIGHWLYSSWRLAKAQGNLEQAKQHAQSALYYFNAVEKPRFKDAEEIKAWLKEINRV